MPLTRTTQVRAAYAALLEEPPRRLPVVLLRLAHASRRLLLQQGIYQVCKRFERGNVSPGARAHGAHEENAKGGEAEAALALLRGRTPVEDADAAMGIVSKVTAWEKACFSSEENGEGT
jgi:hypothetical protein